ncbi:MAG: aspartate aminotransferase family protein [Dehalococcoidia bacterium]|nr:aspartate aminotransferase family protein [Dehalococcoidia bacterium]
MNEKLKNLLDLENEKYINKTKNSYIKHQTSQDVMPGGNTRTTQWMDPYPFFVKNASGLNIHDIDGNNYLDFMLNATTLILGHAHPEIVRTLSNQIKEGTVYSAPTDGQFKLADILVNRIPSIEKIRFTNSGTEATMMAIMAARSYTRKTKIAKFEGGYHGTHDHVSVSVYPKKSELNASTHPGISEYSSQPKSILEDVIVMPYNDIEKTKELINKYKDDLSCIILEPIISNFGYLPLDLEFLQFIRDITTELNIVLIFDEIQSFRVSNGGAQEAFNIIPDMTTLGKVIGGGLPIGAFGGKDEIMDLFDPTSKNFDIAHAGTFNGNPLTMEAGVTVMNNLKQNDFISMNNLGEELRKQLRSVFDEIDLPVQVTGYASLFGINFNENKITDYRSFIKNNSDIAKVFFAYLRNKGILLQVKNAGALNTLMTTNEIDFLVDSTREIAIQIKEAVY